jgi:hypothetical protein
MAEKAAEAAMSEQQFLPISPFAEGKINKIDKIDKNERLKNSPISPNDGSQISAPDIWLRGKPVNFTEVLPSAASHSC